MNASRLLSSTRILMALVLTVALGACGTAGLDASDSPLPVALPDDFEASFSQDGGMAPWFEDIVITPDEGRYEVWMEDVQLNVLFTPERARVEALYAEIRNGRFDAYETKDLDEMIYDGESLSWAVEAGGERYRVAQSGGQDYEAPDTDYSPLRQIETFVDLELLEEWSELTVVFEPSLADTWGTEVTIDLRGFDFGIGDDRWNEELLLGVAATGPITVPVEASRFEDQVSTTVVEVEPGDRIIVRVIEESVTVTSAP